MHILTNPPPIETMLKQFIEQLKVDLNLEQALDANDDGSYSLHFEPDIDVTLQESTERTIFFKTKLAKLPTHDTEDYLLKAMSGNLFGRETGGAILGLDNEGKRVVLLDFLLGEQNYNIFHERLEDFVNYAEAWRRETIEFSEKHNAEE